MPKPLLAAASAFALLLSGCASTGSGERSPAQRFTDGYFRIVPAFAVNHDVRGGQGGVLSAGSSEVGGRIKNFPINGGASIGFTDQERLRRDGPESGSHQGSTVQRAGNESEHSTNGRT
jgi:hypothetical protein